MRKVVLKKERDRESRGGVKCVLEDVVSFIW